MRSALNAAVAAARAVSSEAASRILRVQDGHQGRSAEDHKHNPPGFKH
jgi:hypothetical protein